MKFATTTMKAFADAACERKFAPVLKPHELIHNAMRRNTKGKPRTLLLVSDNLPEHELLIDAALPSATVIAVKYDSWSLDALWEAITKRAWTPPFLKFDAVGILDHGAPGRFCLLKSVGGGDIDLADLASSDIAAFLKALGGLVKPGGRIDLLGCSVAAGAEGRALLAQVEALAGVTVAASTDKTGGAADADWEMESHGLNVAKDYFDVEALKEWKHAAMDALGRVEGGSNWGLHDGSIVVPGLIPGTGTFQDPTGLTTGCAIS